MSVWHDEGKLSSKCPMYLVYLYVYKAYADIQGSSMATNCNVYRSFMNLISPRRSPTLQGLHSAIQGRKTHSFHFISYYGHPKAIVLSSFFLQLKLKIDHHSTRLFCRWEWGNIDDNYYLFISDKSHNEVLNERTQLYRQYGM